MAVENPNFITQPIVIPTELEIKELDRDLMLYDIARKACGVATVIGVIAFGAGIAMLKEDVGNEPAGVSLELGGGILAAYGFYSFNEATRALNSTRDHIKRIGLKIIKTKLSLKVQKINYQPSLSIEN